MRHAAPPPPESIGEGAPGPRGLRLFKDHWDGNGWPSIELDRPAPHSHEAADFLPVLLVICAELHLPLPPVQETLDGYIADLEFEGQTLTLLLDNWTFSLATKEAPLRDRVFAALVAAAAAPPEP